MKVEIEISDETARWLRSMASVGRLCDGIKRALQSAAEELPDKSRALEAVFDAIEDVGAAKPALMELHLTLRPILVDAGVKPLWDQNQGVSHGDDTKHGQPA